MTPLASFRYSINFNGDCDAWQSRCQIDFLGISVPCTCLILKLVLKMAASQSAWGKSSCNAIRIRACRSTKTADSCSNLDHVVFCATGVVLCATGVVSYATVVFCATDVVSNATVVVCATGVVPLPLYIVTSLSILGF